MAASPSKVQPRTQFGRRGFAVDELAVANVPGSTLYCKGQLSIFEFSDDEEQIVMEYCRKSSFHSANLPSPKQIIELQDLLGHVTGDCAADEYLAKALVWKVAGISRPPDQGRWLHSLLALSEEVCKLFRDRELNYPITSGAAQGEVKRTIRYWDSPPNGSTSSSAIDSATQAMNRTEQSPPNEPPMPADGPGDLHQDIGNGSQQPGSSSQGTTSTSLRFDQNVHSQNHTDGKDVTPGGASAPASLNLQHRTQEVPGLTPQNQTLLKVCRALRNWIRSVIWFVLFLLLVYLVSPFLIGAYSKLMPQAFPELRHSVSYSNRTDILKLGEDLQSVKELFQSTTFRLEYSVPQQVLCEVLLCACDAHTSPQKHAFYQDLVRLQSSQSTTHNPTCPKADCLGKKGNPLAFEESLVDYLNGITRSIEPIVELYEEFGWNVSTYIDNTAQLADDIRLIVEDDPWPFVGEAQRLYERRGGGKDEYQTNVEHRHTTPLILDLTRPAWNTHKRLRSMLSHWQLLDDLQSNRHQAIVDRLTNELQSRSWYIDFPILVEACKPECIRAIDALPKEVPASEHQHTWLNERVRLACPRKANQGEQSHIIQREVRAGIWAAIREKMDLVEEHVRRMRASASMKKDL